MTSAGCPFCLKFRRDGRGLDPVFDRILWEDEDLVIVPAIGGFVEGYLMIIPRQHDSCAARVSPEMLKRLESAKTMVRTNLERVYGRTVFFEHGPVAPSNAGGSCIQHVHLHCVPTEIDLIPTLENRHPAALRETHHYSEIARQATLQQSYVYYETQNGRMFVFSDERLPSQYIRRLLATALGFQGVEWDYAVFPFEENARRTVDALNDIRWSVP